MVLCVALGLVGCSGNAGQVLVESVAWTACSIATGGACAVLAVGSAMVRADNAPEVYTYTDLQTVMADSELMK